MAFAAILRWFSKLISSVRLQKTAMVLIGFITATIDEVATNANSIGSDICIELIKSCLYIRFDKQV
jgi:hypothetical protein